MSDTIEFSKLSTEEQERAIAKLLGITEHIKTNKNENEAASATARLTEQLNKYNLTMADLERRGDRKKTPYGMHNYQYRPAKEIRSKWKHILLGMLCRYNGAAAFTKQDSNYMTVIGEAHTFSLIVELYEALVKKLTHLCDLKQIILSARDGGWTPSKTIRFKTDWLMGAITGIEQKLEERDDYFRRAAEVGTMALVVYREKALEEALDIHLPKRGKGRQVEVRFSAGYYDGLKTGFGHAFEKEVRA